MFKSRIDDADAGEASFGGGWESPKEGGRASPLRFLGCNKCDLGISAAIEMDFLFYNPI